MKYLELIKGQFTADHEARAKQLEPYVAYSEEAGGVMYTFIPEPVTGPAANEIWYKTSDNGLMSFYVSLYSKARIAENTETNFQSNYHLLNTGDIINGRNYLNGDPITTYAVVDHSYHPELGCCVLAFDKPFTTLLPICISYMSFDSGSFAVGSDNSRIIAMHLPSNSWYGIPDGMLGLCDNLIEINLGKPYKISHSAFCRCSSLTSITFEGTTEEWNSIIKETNWNYNVPATVVHCTDGDVEI